MSTPMRAVLNAFVAGWVAAAGAGCVILGALGWGLALGALAGFVLWDSTGAAVEMGAALGSGPSGVRGRDGAGGGA